MLYPKLYFSSLPNLLFPKNQSSYSMCSSHCELLSLLPSSHKGMTAWSLSQEELPAMVSSCSSSFTSSLISVLLCTQHAFIPCSVARLCPTLCNPMDCSTAGPPVPHRSPQICPSSCPLRWWCHPAISSSDALFSFCPQSFPALGTFPMSHIKWPKYWSFSFTISPSNEYSGLISLKIDWFDLLAVQGTLFSTTVPYFC